VYICGVNLFFIFAVCCCGMHLWLVFVMCICSVYLLCAFVVYICCRYMSCVLAVSSHGPLGLRIYSLCLWCALMVCI